MGPLRPALACPSNHTALCPPLPSLVRHNTLHPASSRYIQPALHPPPLAHLLFIHLPSPTVSPIISHLLSPCIPSLPPLVLPLPFHNFLLPNPFIRLSSPSSAPLSHSILPTSFSQIPIPHLFDLIPYSHPMHHSTSCVLMLVKSVDGCCETAYAQPSFAMHPP